MSCWSHLEKQEHVRVDTSENSKKVDLIFSYVYIYIYSFRSDGIEPFPLHWMWPRTDRNRSVLQFPLPLCKPKI